MFHSRLMGDINYSPSQFNFDEPLVMLFFGLDEDYNMRRVTTQLLFLTALIFAFNATGSIAVGQDGYRLAAGDVLGVFVEGVVGEIDSTPPVQYPQAESDLPPSIGFPTVVLEDGTLSLPVIGSISVQGLRIEQAEQAVKRAYRGGEKPIVAANNRIIVTLARKRTIEVTVIRQDAISSRPINFRGGVTDRSDSSARGDRLQLSEGDNNLLTALIETGGIPGLNAKPYVRVSRKTASAAIRSKRSTSPTVRTRSARGSHFPRTVRTEGRRSATSYSRDSLRSHTSFYRGFHAPQRTEFFIPLEQQSAARLKNVTLTDGDIVQISARPTEVYYTGGLLRGGEFALPRDKRLDVLEAISIAGSTVGGNAGIVAGSVPPTELLVVRKLPGGAQRTFRVDLNRALVDVRQRPEVAAGDTLILRYKPVERATNAGIQIFNTVGTRQLFGR